MIWTTIDIWIIFTLTFMSIISAGMYIDRTIQKEKAKEPVPVKVRTYIDPRR